MLKRTIAAGLVILAAGIPAHAVEFDSMPRDLKGGYVSVVYPQGEIAGASSGMLGFQPAPGDAGARLTLGYRLNEGVHVEAALANTRYMKGPGLISDEVPAQTGSIATLLYMPISTYAYPFVKVGMATVSVGYGQDYVTTPMSGVGVVVPLGSDWSARFEVERLDRFGTEKGQFTQAFVGVQIRL